MKLLLTGALSMSLFALKAQTTQPNGVIVNEAIGVEGKILPQTKIESVTRTINDWNLAECIDALHVLELKINEASTEEKISYSNQIELIKERMKELETIEK